MTGTHWVFPRTGLDASKKRKKQNNCPYQKQKHDFSDFQRVAYALGSISAPHNKSSSG